MRLAALLACLASPALAVGTEDAPASLAPAEAALAAEDYARALTLLSPIVAEEPRNADALNLVGFASRRMGALEQAASAYEAALTAEPDHLGALEYQGELFVLLGETAMAEANLARLGELCGECEERAALAAAIASGEGW